MAGQEEKQQQQVQLDEETLWFGCLVVCFKKNKKSECNVHFQYNVEEF